jgi:putative tricarboxylic transport membrane protein
VAEYAVHQLIRHRLPGIVVGMLGAGAIWGARSFPTPPGQLYGPAMFPTAIGTGLILCAVAIAMRQAPTTPPLVEADAPGGRRAALIYAMAPALVLVMFEMVGWPLLCAPLVAGLLMLAGARLMTAILVGFCISVFTWVVFAMVLRVPLPRGPLFFLPY